MSTRRKSFSNKRWLIANCLKFCILTRITKFTAMIRVGFHRLLILFFLAVSSNSFATSPILAKGAKLILLADGFGFTEGPAADKAGNVYFTDQPNNKILIWSVDGQLSTFHNAGGRANGLYFDDSGNLLSCSDENNELWSIDMNGNATVLLSGFNGHKLNGPNDLWIDPQGGIYFTDPLYKRPYWTRDPEMQQDGEHLYYITPDRGQVIQVDRQLVKPNGIVGTPDGKYLYVADIGDRKTYRYTIAADGTLQDRKLFAEMGSDGMTIDAKGNVYLTGRGVTVFDKRGKQIEHIPVEANWTANVCFGGPRHKTLFITASQYLYSIEMKVKGAR